MLSHSKKGYMLANLIVGLIVFGTLAGGIAMTIHAINEAQGSAAARAQSEAERSAQKESSLYGLDATALNPVGAVGASPSTMTNPSTLGTGGRGGADLQGMVLSGDTAGRSSAAGIRILGADGTGSTPTGPTPDPVDLIAPIVNYDGALPLAAGLFPVTDMVTLPTGNPSGTFYTYTTDGTNPQRGGSRWNGTESYSAANLPAEFRIQAYHDNDDLYSPSAIATGSLTASASISYEREPVMPGGYSIYDFDFDMINDGTNRIILGTDNETGLYSLEYSIEGGAATGIGLGTTIALALSDWTSPSIELDVRVVGVNPNFPVNAGWHRTYILSAVTQPLLPPVINYGPAFPSAGSFPITDLVTFPVGNPAGTQYHYTISASDPTSSSPLWTGTESLSPADLPEHFRIQARHPSAVFYSPSAVVSVTFVSPIPSIVYDREGSLPGGYTIYEFDKQMIDTASNRAELSLVGHEGVFSMRYRLNGGTWMSAGTFARFMPPASEWSTGTVLLEAEVVAEGYFAADPAWNTSYVLTARPVKLATPIINYGPAFPWGAFPFANMVTFPASNPPATTTYHYTTNNSDPTDASGVWTNSITFTATNLPAHFACVAYPDDTVFYLPSDVAKVTFTNPGGPGGVGSLGITYDRENGGALPSPPTVPQVYDIFDFDYVMIWTDSYRAIFRPSNDYGGLYYVQYSYGSGWSGAGPEVYFHVPASAWSGDTHNISGRLVSRNSNFPLSGTVSRTVTINRVVLPLPPPS